MKGGAPPRQIAGYGKSIVATQLASLNSTQDRLRRRSLHQRQTSLKCQLKPASLNKNALLTQSPATHALVDRFRPNARPARALTITFRPKFPAVSAMRQASVLASCEHARKHRSAPKPAAMLADRPDPDVARTNAARRLSSVHCKTSP